MLNLIYKIIGIKKCLHEFQIVQKRELYDFQYEKDNPVTNYLFSDKNKEKQSVGLFVLQKCKKCGELKEHKFWFDK